MSQVVTEDLGDFDVLVVGGGIAGATAALSAAECGAKVALACAGPVFSGSSFFAGTWGLGLVGPASDGVEDFERTILEVGQGVTDPALVHELVSETEPAIQWLESLGCILRRAERAAQREFIPCFDHSQRNWHGLERASFRAAFGPALERADVLMAPGILYARDEKRLCSINAAATVLATGGFGGLFERTLTMPDVLGTAQAIALEQGARLINCEFMQIMPGLVAPVANVVFNEKTFRFARIEGLGETEGLLGARSEHGPFTASRPDREVDFAIAAAGDAGARVTYDLPDELPEFMKTFSDWLLETHGIRPDDELRVAHYAHAHNGGILIGADAAVAGVPGLYACGECTGGMHGADRIGGLASANALVFGRVAGREAAGFQGKKGEVTGRLDAVASPLALQTIAELKPLMSRHCMVARTEDGLAQAAEAVSDLKHRLTHSAEPSADAQAIAATRRAELSLLSAEALICTMRARTESRGSHHRADFPGKDPAQARPVSVYLADGAPIARPLA